MFAHAQKQAIVPAKGILQRNRDKCRKKNFMLQRAAVSSVPETMQPVVHDVPRPLEQSINLATHAFVETGFGYDFTRVPLHSADSAKEDLQRKEVPGQPLDQELRSETLDGIHEVVHSSGQPLDPGTRRFMESRIGHDFSQVRVHTDARAAASARSVNALAYTLGTHLVLDEQSLPVRSYARQKVLAHELTHVVQQSHVLPSYDVRLCNNSRLEAQAHHSANRIMRGQSVHVDSAQTGGLMRIPLSLEQSIDPQTLSIEEIAAEIDEIDLYLETCEPQETVEHLRQMRQYLVAQQQRPSVNAAPSQPVPSVRASGPPFFGLRPAQNAFQGIQMYYTVDTLPDTSRVIHRFNRGPYLIALNEALMPDGSSQIGYYIAYRRADTLLVGDQGWNEFVVGPDSIEQFLGNLSIYVGLAATVYAFGPPAPYQAASGQVAQRALEGNLGGSVRALGTAWLEAVQDPSWWLSVASSMSGTLGSRAPAPQAHPPSPRLGSLPGGRPGPIPMRVGPGGRPVVASTPRPVAPQGPIARGGGGIQGTTATNLAPLPEPVVPPQPTPTLVPHPAPGPTVQAPQTPIHPVLGATGAAVASTVRRQPVMPSGLSRADQELWRTCNQQHNAYKAIQDNASSYALRMDTIEDNLHNSRATPQERVDFCSLIDERIRLAQRLHQGRLRYIRLDCDRFDWYPEERRTAAQRHARHQEELGHVSEQIRNLLASRNRFCR
jgi:hypothetical protein